MSCSIFFPGSEAGPGSHTARGCHALFFFKTTTVRTESLSGPMATPGHLCRKTQAVTTFQGTQNSGAQEFLPLPLACGCWGGAACPLIPPCQRPLRTSSPSQEHRQATSCSQTPADDRARLPSPFPLAPLSPGIPDGVQ